jgi:ABC-2 type transport system ATP-binding protein
VGLLFDGRIVLESGVDELLEGRVEYWDASCDDVPAEALPGYESRATQGGRLYFRIASAEQLDAWVDAVRAAGGRVVQVSPHRHTLEDYFLGAVRGDRGSDEGNGVGVGK